MQNGVVVFRLCPSKSCSNSKKGGCTSDFADFAIDVNTFVNTYLEDQSGNMQWDDKTNLDNVAQCTEYQSGNSNKAYYIGPSCTENGKDVQVGVFTDAYCQNRANVDFAQLSGASSSYSNGGLVSSSCIPCAEKDENGDYVARDLCGTLYEQTPYRCETDWNVPHYYWDAMTEIYRYGQDKTGCKFVNKQERKQVSKTAQALDLFCLAVLVIGSIVGGVYYTMWWKESK